MAFARKECSDHLRLRLSKSNNAIALRGCGLILSVVGHQVVGLIGVLFF
jgi:hypothetical protein